MSIAWRVMTNWVSRLSFRNRECIWSNLHIGALPSETARQRSNGGSWKCFCILLAATWLESWCGTLVDTRIGQYTSEQYVQQRVSYNYHILSHPVCRSSSHFVQTFLFWNPESTVFQAQKWRFAAPFSDPEVLWTHRGWPPEFISRFYFRCFDIQESVSTFGDFPIGTHTSEDGGIVDLDMLVYQDYACCTFNALNLILKAPHPPVNNS